MDLLIITQNSRYLPAKTRWSLDHIKSKVEETSTAATNTGPFYESVDDFENTKGESQILENYINLQGTSGKIIFLRLFFEVIFIINNY